MTPPLRNFPLGIRIILMFILFFFCLILFAAVAVFFVPILFGIDNPEAVFARLPQSSNEIAAYLFVQAVSALGGFFFWSLAFAQLEAGNATAHLRMNRGVSVKLLLITIFAILVSQFFLEFLVDINKAIPLPKSLSFLLDKQKENQDLTNALLNFRSPLQFFNVAFVLAILPAISEEMFFRGLLLGDLLKGGVRPAAAIIFSGLVFAMAHFEYENTIAIWLLGSFLGYLYYASGSLWLSVSAHFINNFLQVFLKYLYNTGRLSQDIVDAPMPLYISIIAIVVFAGCVFLINKWKNKPDFVPSFSQPQNESSEA